MRTGEFNREGAINGDTVIPYGSDEDVAPSATPETLAEAAIQVGEAPEGLVLSGDAGREEAAVPAADETDPAEAAEEAEEPAVDNDLDNDGHDDQTGQFVEGNQEAAAAVATDEAVDNGGEA